MVRGANPTGDSVISLSCVPMPVDRGQWTSRKGLQDVAHNNEVQALVERDACPGPPIAPFVLGTVIGGLAGAILGTVLSPHTRGFVVGLVHLISRRISSSERDQLRFELLLQ